MAGYLAVVLVGHNDEQVSRRGDRRRSSQPVAGRSYKPFPRDGVELFLLCCKGRTLVLFDWLFPRTSQ